MTVDPGCTNTIREFETWERKPNDTGYGDKFMDKHNHAMDALRYVAKHLDGGDVALSYAVGPKARDRRGVWS